MGEYRVATSHIGGVDGSLDNINGNLLSDGHKAVVVEASGQVWWYNLDSDSGLGEDRTNFSVITPDNNSLSKRWILVGKTGRVIIPDSTIDQGDDAVVGTLAWHIADLAGSSADISVLEGTYTVSTNTVVPATVNLVIKPATISVDNGITLTLNCSIAAGQYAIFEGLGTTVLSGAVGIVYDAWNGGSADTLTIDSYELSTVGKQVMAASDWGVIHRGVDLLINSTFELWLTGTSFSTPGFSTNSYCATGWVALWDGAGDTITISQPGGPLATGATNSLRWNNSVSGTSTYRILEQRIENSGQYSGTQRTFSFIARADAARTVTLEFIQFYGTGGGLITNGDFTTNIASWTDESTGGGTIAHDAVNDEMEITGDGADYGWAEQEVTTVDGEKYIINFDVADFAIEVLVGTTTNAENLVTAVSKAIGTGRWVTFTASGTSAFIGFKNQSASVSSIDNVDCVSKPVQVFTEDFSVTTSWTQFSKTATVPAVTNKQWGSNYNDHLTLRFKYPTGTTFWVDLTQVQIDKGDIVLPFRFNGQNHHITDSERLHQYLLASSGHVAVGADEYIYTPVCYRQRMRGTPAITIGAGTRWNNKAGTPAVSGNTTYGAYYYIASDAAGPFYAFSDTLSVDARFYQYPDPGISY